MELSRRQGGVGGLDLAGMAWDEMVLESVLTSSVLFTVIEIYNDNQGGALEMELYTGSSKQCFVITYIIKCGMKSFPFSDFNGAARVEFVSG